LARGELPQGDLIPWTMGQQFQVRQRWQHTPQYDCAGGTNPTPQPSLCWYNCTMLHSYAVHVQYCGACGWQCASVSAPLS
jgi:hypothetical protein